jgi:hypothetical protein
MYCQIYGRTFENFPYILHEICTTIFYKIYFFSDIGKILHLLNTFSHNNCGLFIFKKSLKPGPWELIAVGGANI